MYRKIIQNQLERLFALSCPLNLLLRSLLHSSDTRVCHFHPSCLSSFFVEDQALVDARKVEVEGNSALGGGWILNSMKSKIV